ncbi:MAG TPA: DUF6295 family protein [Acidimicrobiales bacterium]|nr:DUF6295 family protein [Acidimicrobiales bacterium]
MCTYNTEVLEISASAKGATGWFPATTASVYFDHPVHYAAGHALIIDVLNSSRGPSARAAIEMDAVSARQLAETILRTLDAVPVELLEG